MRVLAAVLLLAGCGVPVDEPHAGLTPFEPRSGAYRIWTLAPPWREAPEAVARDEVALAIPSNAERRAGVTEVPPKYELRASLAAGAPRALAQRIARRATAAEELRGPRPFATDAGVEGWETVTFDLGDGRYRRHLFLAAPGGSVEIALASNVDLDDPEVDAMLAAVEVGPFSAL